MLAVGIFQSLGAFLRGGTTGFLPLEEQVLDGVAEQLDSDRARKFRESVARINLVQRLDGGREVNAYEMRSGKPVLDEAPRLTDADGEKALAEFKLTTGVGAENTGKVWLVDGRFFSLEFRDPTEHMLNDRLENLQVKLVS